MGIALAMQTTLSGKETEAALARNERTHLENFLHDTVEPLKIIKQAFREDKTKFWSEIRSGFNLAFNPIIKGPEGKWQFNPRAPIYWGGLMGLMIGATACARALDNNGGPNVNPGDGNGNTDGAALCSNLLRIAAANSADVAVDHAVWSTATTDNHPLLEQDLNTCFSPDSPGKPNQLIISAILPQTEIGGDVALMAWIHQAEEVSQTPLLALPAGEVDADGDGQPDFQLLKFIKVNPDFVWGKQPDGSYETVLRQVDINAATGSLDDDGLALVKAVKGEDGKTTFTIQIFNDDGTNQSISLSQEGVSQLGPSVSWLDQIAALDTAPDTSLVEGQDLSTASDGAKYGFNDALDAQLRGQGWKLVEDSTGHINGTYNAQNNTCAVVMPENLLTGSWIGDSSDGTVTYYFASGKPDQVALWHNLPLPEEKGWRWVAVVAQTGNQLGPDGSELAPNTVAVKLVRDDGKGGFEIKDGFLQVMWDAKNQAVFERTENGVKITVTTPDKITFIREMQFAAPLPAEIAAAIGSNPYRIDPATNHIFVTVNGQEQDWYEMNAEKQWQTSDWKMFEDAPLKIGLQPEKDWSKDPTGIVVSGFPIITGETTVERQINLNGQEIFITALPAKIRDSNNIIKNVLIPLIYKDKARSTLLETWFKTENGIQPIADFIKIAKRGRQLEMYLHFVNQRQNCEGGLRCEIKFDLNKAQGINIFNINNGDILPVGTILESFLIGNKYIE